jgi:hypothetical protein
MPASATGTGSRRCESAVITTRRPTVQTTTDSTYTVFELDRREGDGIVVSLLWDKSRDRTSIALSDERSDAELHFEVPSARALDAFRHPYVYAAREGLLPAPQPRDPVYA